MSLTALPLVFLLAFPSATPCSEDADLERAAELVTAQRWQEACDLLRERLKRSADDPRALELYGQSLYELGRSDEAAHYLDQSAARWSAQGDERSARRAKSELVRADPLASRRERLFQTMTGQLAPAAKQLFENGHPERALELLQRLSGIATGKDAEAIAKQLAEVKKRFEQVDLDRAGAERGPDGWPLVELESEHYKLSCNLEPEIVQLVADTMDDVHAYYVELYFDGDEKKAKGAKAEIRTYPDREAMLAHWGGGEPPEGWWSPGENRVTCYDTRTSTGSLDWMLTTLFHEASHQFMTLLSRKGGWAPAWLNEGTASFFEGAVAMADHRVLWPDAALPRLMGLCAMLQGGTGPTLSDVVSFSGGGSYPGEDYPFGWGLVYFMQQYEEPASLVYVYRPLYARYREEITSKGGDPMQLFEQVFLGKDSPLHHQSFADFERDWRQWILETVRPLHVGPEKERRELRTARAKRYLEAADAAAGNRRAPVSEEDLLLRALGDVEYVRTKVDGPEHPELAIYLMQADLLERLDRPEGAAPLVEAVLNLADAGTFVLTEDEYDAQERRLKKLDSRNWALRTARSRAEALARSAERLVDEYRHAKEPKLLRAYTFAAAAGAALDDEKGLLALASELREEARAAGLLLGSVRALDAARGAWATIYNNEPKDLRIAPEAVELESVRPIAFVDTSVELGTEYELRARLVRRGDLYASASHGLVVAGSPDAEWMVFGFTDDGNAGLWRITLVRGGGASSRMIDTIPLDPPLAPDERPELALHVSNRRDLEVRVGERAPLRASLPSDFAGGKYAGVYVKDGRVELQSFVAELYP